VNLLESFRVALRALRANRMRAALTMLGVIIGVSAVILLVSIGAGVQGYVTGQIQGLGSNLLFVFPQKESDRGPGGGGTVGKKFQMSDAATLKSRVDVASAVVPLVEGQVTVKVGRDTFNSTLSGGGSQAGEVTTAKFVAGASYTAADVDGYARVAVVGFTIADSLGGPQQAVGRTIDISGQQFKVIGVLEKQGGGLGGSQDKAVGVPITSAQRLLGSTDLSMIAVKVKNQADMELARTEIKRALKARFKDNVSIFSQDQMLGILSTVLGTMTVMLAGIAGISLLVGGIGIMNIMLVSVTERTREIGIRLAIGARSRDILRQFLVESMVLSAVGGVAGIVLGIAGTWAVARGIHVPFVVPAQAAPLAFGVSVAVGVAFGVFPARKASRLNPLAALRFE
jgi:putative ABC transport system permease protein